jgi:hypothetical protein
MAVRSVYYPRTSLNQWVECQLLIAAKISDFWPKWLLIIFCVWLSAGNTRLSLSYLGWKLPNHAQWDLLFGESAHALASRLVVFRTFWIQFQSPWGWAESVDWGCLPSSGVVSVDYFPIELCGVSVSAYGLSICYDTPYKLNRYHYILCVIKCQYSKLR